MNADERGLIGEADLLECGGLTPLSPLKFDFAVVEQKKSRREEHEGRTLRRYFLCVLCAFAVKNELRAKPAFEEPRGQTK